MSFRKYVNAYIKVVFILKSVLNIMVRDWLMFHYGDFCKYFLWPRVLIVADHLGKETNQCIFCWEDQLGITI